MGCCLGFLGIYKSLWRGLAVIDVGYWWVGTQLIKAYSLLQSTVFRCPRRDMFFVMKVGRFMKQQ